MTHDFITLVNPPSPPLSTANREGAGGLGVVVEGRGGFVYPPLLLAEAAATFHRVGRAVRGVDLVFRPLRARWLLRDVRGPILIRTSAATLEHDIAWARARFVDDAPVTFAAPGVERPALPARWGWSDAPDGHAVAAAMSGIEPEAFADAPFADWSRFSLGRSRRLGLYHTRGCTKSCTYCPYVVATGRTLTERPVAKTLAEIAHQCGRHRVKRIVFRDPTFGLTDDTFELLQGLRAQRVPFEVESRPDVLTDDHLRALKDAGCAELKLGVETLLRAPLIATGRVDDSEQGQAYAADVRRVLETADALGLRLRLFLLSGLPGQAGEDPVDALVAGRTDVVRKSLSTWPNARAGEMGR